jgi:hypothetical protein
MITSKLKDQLDDECNISKLLTQHQQRILNRSQLSEHLNFPNDDLDEINNELTLELDFEDDFFEKINKTFRKIHELSPIAIMEIMTYYRGKLNIILLFIIFNFNI